MPDDDHDPVLALHDVRAEDCETHRLLAAILERLPPHDTDRQRRVELLSLVAQVVGHEAFTVTELYRWITAARAAGDPLRQALGDTSAKACGKLFARWSAHGPYVVRESESRGDGVRWRVVGDFPIAKSPVPIRAKLGEW